MTKEYGVTHFTELHRILHKYFLIRRCQRRALGFLYFTILANTRYRALSSAYADGLFVKTAIKTNACHKAGAWFIFAVCYNLLRRLFGRTFAAQICDKYYIIPMPGLPAGIAGASSLMFATTDSVVSSVDATLVAFCRALLVTFAGSRIPASTIFTYSSFSAS